MKPKLDANILREHPRKKLRAILEWRRGEGTEKKEDSAGKMSEIPAPEHREAIGHEKHAELTDPDAVVTELQNRLMRLQAEFENYKKRAVRENEMIREGAAAEMILGIIPIVDEFEIAMGHLDRSSATEFKQGMELIYSKLKDMMKKDGVEEMKALGESFDPYKHDALRQGDGEEGKVVEVVIKGYLYGGKVLRHAKVVVGKDK